MPKVEKVRLKIVSLAPDPIQYKPWSPVFEPENLILEVSLPAEEIRREGDEVILTLSGFTTMLKEIGLEIEKMHNHYNKEIKKGV